LFAAIKAPNTVSTATSTATANSNTSNSNSTSASPFTVPSLLRYQAWRDLHRLAHFEPEEWHVLFFRDVQAWERVSQACLEEVSVFTARMEHYCTSKRKYTGTEVQATFGEGV
jgi:hypothetical protein